MRVFIILALIIVSHTLFGQASIEQGKKLYEDRKPIEAKRLFEQIKKTDSGYGVAQYYLGRIAYDERRYDQALTHFEAAISTNDKVADYHYWSGNAMGVTARDANKIKQGYLAPKIKSAYEKTVALDPKNLNAHWGLINFYVEAPGIMGGSWAKAEETAKAILQNIDKAEGYRALAFVYARQEKFDLAEENYIKAYKEDPRTLTALGLFYQNRKEYDKAFKLFDDALKKDPENHGLIYQYGRVAAVSGKNLEKGEQCMKKYLAYTPKENEPSHAGAYMRLGMIYEKQGKQNPAKQHYQKALDLDPNMKDAQDGLSRLSK